jgi:hypothetical protein
LQRAQIFSAPSLSEVFIQLVRFHLSGILTFRRAAGPRRDEVSIMVQDGRPLRIRSGVYEVDANQSVLQQLNAWGEIHFIFLPRSSPRQLPPPGQPVRQEQAGQQPSRNPPQLRASPPVTQPLPALPATSRGSQGRILTETQGQSQSKGKLRIHRNRLSQDPVTTPTPGAKGGGGRFSVAPEATIPSLTAKAKNYPIMNVPRYDRTILLLINGSRSISDLTHLTKRSLPAIYASLSRLRDQQLIEVSL